MRAGGEYFLEPAEAVQRRYEALRCYFVEDASAESVGARFGYSPATVHQLAAELRAGRSSFFRSSKPGPKGPRKTHTIRDRVLVLRAADRSVTEIAQALTAQGDAVSAQTVWAILKSEGLERLERRGPAGPAPRLEPVTAKALGAWPTGARYDCDHAGLYLLLPAMVELGLDQLIGAANYPGTKVLSSFHSVASLLMLKCSRRGRAGNAFPLGADPGLGLALGLLALPKATHLTSYSYRVRRASNLALLEGLGRQCRQVGLYNGQGGFNLDFHTIRHHGEQVPLEEHYVVSRSQRTRSVLTFFAQDHASTEMVYANADITKAEQVREVIAFVRVLEARRRRRSRAAGLRLQTHHLPRARRARRRRHHLPHPAPTRPQSPRSPGRATRLSLADPHRQTRRPLPAPPDPRGDRAPQRHRSAATSDRDPQHRPRPAHPADHQRPHHPRQGPVHPLRRTDDHRERTRRRHQRLPPQRPELRTAPQRRPRHHPHRARRQLLPAARPQTAPLRTRHPRPALATLPGQHRHRHRRRRPRPHRPRAPHLHPSAHRRRLPRTRHPHPLVGRTKPPLRVPTTLNLNPTTGTTRPEDRG